MKKKIAALLVLMMAVMSLVACGKTAEPTVEPTKAATVEATVEPTVEPSEEVSVATGVNVTLRVYDNFGELTEYLVNTDGTSLLDAMNDALGLTYDGYEGEWGYTVTAINGLTADFNTEGAYWSVYVNEEYGMFSVDEQPIAEGDVFELRYEVFGYDPVVYVTVVIVGPDGTEQSYEVTTYGETLLDVLDSTSEITYDGVQENWGYNLTTLNGVTADYEADSAYWAVYVNDEYGMYTCDAQLIADGDTYKFVYETYVIE